MEKIDVGRASEIAPGHGKVVNASGIEIGVFAVSDGFRAYRNVCPHAGAPVCRGEITGGVIRCPWHAWDFDLETGEHTANPAIRLDAFPVEVIDGRLVVSI